MRDEEARQLRNETERVQVLVRESRQRLGVPLAQLSSEVAAAVAALGAEAQALGLRRDELRRLVEKERVESLARKLALATRNERAQWYAAYRLLALIALVSAASLFAVHAGPELSRGASLALSLAALGTMARLAFVTGRSLGAPRTRAAAEAPQQSRDHPLNERAGVRR